MFLRSIIPEYPDQEKITYEVYQKERKIINIKKRKQNNDVSLQNKKQKYSGMKIF